LENVWQLKWPQLMIIWNIWSCPKTLKVEITRVLAIWLLVRDKAN
jgi:hypothetical protein